MRKFFALRAVVLATGFALASAMGIAEVAAQQTDSSPPTEKDLVKRVEQSAIAYKDKVAELQRTLRQRMETIEGAEESLDAMRAAVDELLTEMGMDGPNEEQLRRYMEFAVAEEKRLRGSTNPQLRGMADEWLPRIERAKTMRRRYSDVRIRLRDQLNEIDQKREVIIAYRRLDEFDKAMNEAEATVAGLETISTDLDQIIAIAGDQTAGTGATQ